ncbi:Gfo/Idh/MocA family oxidoreductase [Paenibacillus sp. P26]|nr:Gfo/Idh/MocA family oxidoreductase [Paenibacillus sp. P26]
MQRKLRLAVVGLGRVSKSHLPALRKLSDKIELAALVTRDENKAAAGSRGMGEVRTYTSYDEALRDDGIDAYLLLPPHDLHAEYSIKALQAGKHVLVEKPMAMNVSEAEEMTVAAEAAGVTLMVGQSRRFFRPVMESVRRVRAKEIGELININALLCWRIWISRRRTGGRTKRRSAASSFRSGATTF